VQVAQRKINGQVAKREKIALLEKERKGMGRKSGIPHYFR